MILDKKYALDSYLVFLDGFLPDLSKDIRDVNFNSSEFLSVKSLGKSEFLDLQLLEVTVSDDLGRRVAITNDGFRLLKQISAHRALVVFRSKQRTEWRLSFMTAQPTISEGKIVTKLSNPKRYSYLLGPESKTVTPYRYLIKTGKIRDFEDLKARFSVEVVNRDFYNSIAELYTELVGGKRKSGSRLLEYSGLLKIHGKNNQSQLYQEFAVRLIGRIVFCWFLKEKKSRTGVPLIPTDLLSSNAAKSSMYYHQILEPIFFEVLNTKNSDRKEPFKKEPFSKIPYLNGGLFNPQTGESGDYYKYSDATSGGMVGIVEVPDTWLQNFFELLETYNFTVDENTSYDIDLSIDPEMLGRIFENLLAEINPETGESARKSTGSFYTPRNIVEYMVDRCISYYLSDKTQIKPEKIEALVSYDKLDDLKYPLTADEEDRVIHALSDLKVLDPACGSGAFPIGMLQKIVYILQQVDQDAKKWLDKQLSSSSPEFRRHLEMQFENKNYDYLRKLGVIRESIFGVDIQPIATEIARLRCFLTLVVEEEADDKLPNRGIETLPNLDFKFVSANSLVKLPERGKNIAIGQREIFEDTSHIDELKDIRNKYFGATSQERIGLQVRFNGLQKKMALKNIDEYRYSASKLYNALTRWEPFEHKAADWFDPDWMFGVNQFDIVIGNPPWGQKSVKFTAEEAKYLTSLYPSAATGAKDISRFFIEKSIRSLSADGIYSNILPDIILLKTYDSTRKYILDNLDICNLDHWGMCFENVNLESFTIVGRRGGGKIDSEIDVKIHTKTAMSQKNINQSVFYTNDGYKFNLHINDDERALVSKLSTCETFGDYFSPHEGIHTGNVREKLFIPERQNEKSKKLILGRKEISQYRLSWAGGWVNYDPTIIKHNEGEYAGLCTPDYFDYPKIVVRRTGDYVLAAADREGYYFSNNVFVCIPKDKSVSLDYAVGVLNSRLSTWYYRVNQPRTGKLFAELKINLLTKIPFKLGGQKEQSEIESYVNEIYEANDALKINELKLKIDSLVYRIFELSEDEIEIVEAV